jgi:hypothetical protein
MGVTDKQLLLPPDAADPGQSHVLVRGLSGEPKVLLHAGRRSGGGDAACVSSSRLHAFGGEGAQVNYEPVGPARRIMLDASLFIDFAIAVLSWIGAIFAAVGAFMTNTGDTATPYQSDVAAIVFTVAALLATFKLVKDLRSQ